MMYHCIPIDLRFPSNAKLFQNVRHAELHELVHHFQKHSKKRHRGDDHPGGGDHVFAARPGDLLHLHANVMQKFAYVRHRAGDFVPKTGTHSALRFFVLHFDRLRGHGSSFSPLGQAFLPVLFRFSCARPANAATLAGEEGFEPPYPVLETGVLAVGRLPFTLSPRSGRRVSPLTLLHKLKLLCPAPALNLFFPPPRYVATSAALTPNQLNWSALRGELGTHSPVVPLDSFFYVRRDTDIKSTIPASHHVAGPGAPFCHIASRFCRPFGDAPQGKPES